MRAWVRIVGQPHENGPGDAHLPSGALPDAQAAEAVSMSHAWRLWRGSRAWMHQMVVHSEIILL